MTSADLAGARPKLEANATVHNPLTPQDPTGPTPIENANPELEVILSRLVVAASIALIELERLLAPVPRQLEATRSG